MSRIAPVVTTLAGAVVWIVMLTRDVPAALHGYLVGFIAAMTLLVGALLQVMISYITRAEWFTLFRRFTWALVASLPVASLGIIPVLAGIPSIYSWSSAAVPHSPWMSTPAFVGRSVVYLAVWSVFAIAMTRTADRQDRADAAGIAAAARRLSALSVGGVLAVGITLTFAAFDWVMSLSPRWTSTIFGVYLFAGGYLAALAGLAVFVAMARPDGVVRRYITENQIRALGTLIFMASLLWAYIGFAQLLIIWIGNIPRDAAWYARRAHAGWEGIGAAIAIARFAIPFPLLLFRPLKRRIGFVAGMGILILAGHILDAWWLVIPTWSPALRVDASSVAALVMWAGIVVLLAQYHWRRFNSIPLGDPALERALNYRRQL